MCDSCEWIACARKEHESRARRTSYLSDIHSLQANVLSADADRPLLRKGLTYSI